jgi:hypothetical protein
VITVTLSPEAIKLLDRIATDQQFVNPRTGGLNRSQALEFILCFCGVFFRQRGYRLIM